MRLKANPSFCTGCNCCHNTLWSTGSLPPGHKPKIILPDGAFDGVDIPDWFPRERINQIVDSCQQFCLEVEDDDTLC